MRWLMHTLFMVVCLTTMSQTTAEAQEDRDQEMAQALGPAGKLQGEADGCPKGETGVNCLVRVFTADAEVARTVLLYLLGRKVPGARAGIDGEELKRLLADYLGNPDNRRQFLGDIYERLDDHEDRITNIELWKKFVPEAHLLAGLDIGFFPQGAVGMVEGSLLLVWRGGDLGDLDVRLRGSLLFGAELQGAEEKPVQGVPVEGGPVHGGRLELGFGGDYVKDVGGHAFVGFHEIEGNGQHFLDLDNLDWKSTQLEVGLRLWVWRLEVFGAWAYGLNKERGRTPPVKIGSGAIAGFAFRFL